jgi:hypothetical protein
MAGTTGLEPATSAVTGQRSNQLNYVPRVRTNEYYKAKNSGLRKNEVNRLTCVERLPCGQIRSIRDQTGSIYPKRHQRKFSTESILNVPKPGRLSWPPDALRVAHNFARLSLSSFA